MDTGRLVKVSRFALAIRGKSRIDESKDHIVVARYSLSLIDTKCYRWLFQQNSLFCPDFPNCHNGVAMSGIQTWWRNVTRTFAPLSLGIVILSVAFSILTLIFPSVLDYVGPFGAKEADFLATLFTHSFVARTPVELVFTVLLMYAFGSPSEKILGMRTFAMIWFGSVLIGALCVFAVGGITSGISIPLAVMTLLWALKNRSQSVALYGILNIPAMGFAALMMAVCATQHFTPRLAMVASLIPCLIAFIVYQNQKKLMPREKTRSATRENMAYSEKYFDNVREREMSRQDRERLKKLFEGGDSDEGALKK
jgi:membrane associated rhomboid family serine protease